MNYYEELGAKRESGDPSEEDVDVDYPEEESYEGNAYADEPRMARTAGNTEASSHSAYGGGNQSRPYAEAEPSYQPKPAMANRGNRGAMRLLQARQKPDVQSHAEPEELGDTRHDETERQLDALIGGGKAAARPVGKFEANTDFQGFGDFDSRPEPSQTPPAARHARQLQKFF